MRKNVAPAIVLHTSQEINTERARATKKLNKGGDSASKIESGSPPSDQFELKEQPVQANNRARNASGASENLLTGPAFADKSDGVVGVGRHGVLRSAEKIFEAKPSQANSLPARSAKKIFEVSQANGLLTRRPENFF